MAAHPESETQPIITNYARQETMHAKLFHFRVALFFVKKVAGSKKRRKGGVGEILGFHPKNLGPPKSSKFRSINLSSPDLQLKLMDVNFDDFGGETLKTEVDGPKLLGLAMAQVLRGQVDRIFKAQVDGPELQGLGSSQVRTAQVDGFVKAHKTSG